MERRIEMTRVIKLFLTEEEAAWLHARMQNSPEGVNETPEDSRMRALFFNATSFRD